MNRSTWLALSLLLVASPGASADLAQGRQLELRNLLVQDCGSCHGLQLRGGLGPPLRAENLQEKSAGYIASVILHGRPGTAMPPWQGLLSADEAQWLAVRLLNPEIE